jgi:HK97 family phage major capsid protein
MPTLALNRELRTQWKEKLTAARTLRDRGAKTPEERARLRELVTDCKRLRQRIDDIESSMMGPIRGDEADGGGNRDAGQDEYRRAFQQYLRFGREGMAEEARAILNQRRAPVEQRDMFTGGSGAGIPGVSSGGFFVPVGFVQDVIQTMRYSGPMVDESVTGLMVTDVGNILPYPSENDSSVTGERIGEGQQVTDVDVSLGQILFGAYKYSTRMVKVSIELLEDSAFDLESFLTREFALRLGRSLNMDFTLGTGSANSQPQGIIPATLASGTLLTATGSSTNDGTSAGGNSVGSDDLISLEHSVDPLYRAGASYMASDSTWSAVRRVKDKFGNLLWQRSLIAGQPDLINGHPMLVNPYMDVLQTQSSSPAVTRNVILFGQMRRYMVRRVRSLSVLRLVERFSDYAQVAFIGFARYDGQVLAGPNATQQQFPFALLRSVY